MFQVWSPDLYPGGEQLGDDLSDVGEAGLQLLVEVQRQVHQNL